MPVTLKSLITVLIILSHNTSVYTCYDDVNWEVQKVKRTCLEPSLNSCPTKIGSDKCTLNPPTIKCHHLKCQYSFRAIHCIVPKWSRLMINMFIGKSDQGIKCDKWMESSYDFDRITLALATCTRKKYVHILRVSYNSGFCYEENDSSCSKTACKHKKCCPRLESVSHLQSFKHGITLELEEHHIWSLQKNCIDSGNCTIKLNKLPSHMGFIADFVDIIYSCNPEEWKLPVKENTSIIIGKENFTLPTFSPAVINDETTLLEIKQKQKIVIVVSSVLGIITFLAITMVMVIYKCLKGKANTDETVEIEMPNVRNLESFHVEEQFVNNAEDYAEISDCFTQESAYIEASYINAPAEYIDIISYKL